MSPAGSYQKDRLRAPDEIVESQRKESQVTNSMKRLIVACACLTAVQARGPVLAASSHTLSAHVHTSNARIEEALHYAMKRSPSFGDLVATFDFVDREVDIEEGYCHHQAQRACLQLMPGGTSIQVKVDPRQTIRAVALDLAHELYHALEVGREPAVVDAASLRSLYDVIGEKTCLTSPDNCWETRAAVAFQALIERQLSSVPPPSGAAR
jgi:hypothetical protein